MSTERTSLHGKIPGKGKTHATGKATKDVVYSVGLKLNEIKSNIVNLQKFSENKWQNVKEGEDLLQINDKLRIIIEDNTGWDGMWQNRSLQYSNNSKILNDILNMSGAKFSSQLSLGDCLRISLLNSLMNSLPDA
jgi:hypothetical protein